MLQFFVDEFGDNGINHCHQRNTEDHAGQAEEAAENNDGDQNPQSIKAGCVAKDLRTDNVSVKLLDNDNNQNEPYGFRRIGDKDDKRTGDCADEGTENRDDVRDADDDTQKRVIRHAENRKYDKAEEGNDGRIQNFTDDEARKGSVRIASQIDDVEIGASVKERVEDFFALCRKLFFGCKEIDCQENTDQQILHLNDDFSGVVKNERNDFCKQRREAADHIGQLGGNACSAEKIVETTVSSVKEERVLDEIIDPYLSRGNITGNLAFEIFVAAHDRRNNHHENNG